MSLTPQITLTATLQDFTGAAVGSVGNPAKLRIALCGFGPTLPRIAGTSMIAKPGPFDIYSTAGTVSISLWGNDVITPAGTFYTIMVLDGDDNVVQCGAYQFAGTETIDLSSAAQIVVPGPMTAAGLVALACPGTTPGNVFTVPTQIWNAMLIGVFYRGSFYASNAYTLSGQTLTMGFACTELPYALYTQAVG